MEEARKIAGFFYRFMPMDDYPSEKAVDELAKDIEWLPRDGLLYEYMSGAYDRMSGCKREETRAMLSFDGIEEGPDYRFQGVCTRQGTPYIDIARFLMRMLDTGLLMRYDDNTHYNNIGKALQTAPKGIEYILSAAAENTSQPICPA